MELIRRPLPNASAVLVMGILSVILGCGLLGLVFGIIGLALSKEGKRLYDENPDGYTGYGNLNAGRIMSIIGIVIGGIILFYAIIALAITGSVLGIIAGAGGF